jgi:HEAT repeat protein
MASEIDDLFAQTMEGAYEDDAPWQAVQSLRRTGTRQVFEKAAEWTKSSVPLMRARGLDVLAQLGTTVEHPSNNLPLEVYDLVTEVLETEHELQPLSSAIAALGHLGDQRAIPLIASHQSDSRSDVRFTVACALGSFPNDALSVATMITLSEDGDDDVRDWATFELGVLGDVDSAQVREALCRRLNDSDLDAQEEAISGLAKRHDARILPIIIPALEKSPVSGRVVQAAYTLLGRRTGRIGRDWIMPMHSASAFPTPLGSVLSDSGCETAFPVTRVPGALR